MRTAIMPGMDAEPLKVLSSMATRELLAELIACYRHDTALAVTAEAAGGVDVAKRVQAGERVDVVVLAGTAIDTLTANGSVRAGSRRDLVKSGIAIAVRAGAARPDISSATAVRDAILAASGIGYSTGPSGVHLEKLLAGWGILETMRERIVTVPAGVPVGSLVADGRVSLGFQQLSELMSLPGIEVLGTLPAAIQSMTVFAGGIGSACSRPDDARALLEYLAAPGTAARKREYGMEPV
jgi:molybdate transport system substrate-binding protein